MMNDFWEQDANWEISWEYLFQPHIVAAFLVWITFFIGSATLAASALGTPRSKSRKSMHDLQEKERKRPSLTPRQLYQQLMEGGLSTTWVKFWTKFPRRSFSFYIDAFLIPAYRPEWGRYKKWSFRSRDRPKKSANLSALLKNRKHQEKLKMLLNNPNVPVPVAHDHHECKRLKINVNGMIYETQFRTLNKFPDTLLGDPERRIKYYDPLNDWYYFDRNRICFEAILYFYQSGGRLRRPENIHMDVFLDDADFYQLPAANVQKFRFDEGLSKSVTEAVVPKELFSRKVWLLFDFPESSSQARILAIISVFVVVISIILFCIETVPAFIGRVETTFVNGKSHTTQFDSVDMADPFFFTETICTTWFTVELLARLLASPNKIHFLISPLNLIDFLAVFPYFLTIATTKEVKAGVDHEKSGSVETTAYLSILRVIRLVRVFRIFKLSRHSKGLKILGRTLHASLSELFLLVFFVFIGIILFSSTMYFCELGENTPFKSIPDGFWWALITTTTVGYGDVVPVTVGGRIVGSLCAIAGVLTIALPVPVIVSNFNYFYHQAIDEQEFNWTKINHVSVCPYRPGGYGPIEDKKRSEFFRERDSSDEYEQLKYNPGKPKKKK